MLDLRNRRRTIRRWHGGKVGWRPADVDHGPHVRNRRSRAHLHRIGRFVAIRIEAIRVQMLRRIGVNGQPCVVLSSVSLSF
ncbi:hypothetical protein L596_006043 [Steinernema carpocapsae]|uniref:Uncharacterized protein n=1 Tax=Steinernema carpocapsae TaxID=34508 RepID=A0A4V6I8N1_STECR|nr:hypothetical protein L596_006043 [Steinernema carpocapsae]